MSVKHPFVSPASDGPDTDKLQPSDWNAAHVFDGGVNDQVLTYDDTQADHVKWAAAPAPAAHTHVLTDVTDADTLDGTAGDALFRGASAWEARALAATDLPATGIAIAYHDSAPADGTVCICLRSPVAGTINSATHRLTSGSVAVAVKIGSTAVTGLGALSPGAKATTNASAANVIAVGDEINLTFSSAADAVGFDLTLNVTIWG